MEDEIHEQEFVSDKRAGERGNNREREKRHHFAEKCHGVIFTDNLFVGHIFLISFKWCQLYQKSPIPQGGTGLFTN